MNAAPENLLEVKDLEVIYQTEEEIGRAHV